MANNTLHFKLEGLKNMLFGYIKITKSNNLRLFPNCNKRALFIFAHRILRFQFPVMYDKLAVKEGIIDVINYLAVFLYNYLIKFPPVRDDMDTQNT